MGSHLCEPVDVVHVVLELGDATVGGGCRAASRWSIAAWSRAASAACSRAESATRSASPSPSSSTSSAGTPPLVSAIACTRLTTMPPNGIRASLSLRWK